MRVDLHFHSQYSDGSQWPSELVEIAKKKGLDMIALTDHDTFGGVHDFIKATKSVGIIGVPAIEIDFIDKKYDFKSEVLGYFPDNNYSNTEKYILPFLQHRRSIALKAIEKAKRMFKIDNLSIEDLLHRKLEGEFDLSITEGISLTKPEVYKYFLEKIELLPYKTYHEFKDEFMADKIFDQHSEKPDFSECIKQINLDGGFAVLAHPALQFKKDVGSLLRDKDNYIKNLLQAKEIGLWGIELHAYDNNIEADKINNVIKGIAKKCGLNVTFGSDSHGPKAARKKELGCMESDFQGFNRNT